MKKRLKWLVVLCCALFVGGASRSFADAASRRPNIIMLFIDDLGYGDTGPFGCTDIPTPHIDRLAEEGVVLTRAYVTNPPCCPSRASLMMGMYGQRFGKYGMSRGMPIPEDKPTFAEVFRDNGYTTGQIGKWDVGDKWQGPSARGFMEVAELPERIEKGNHFMCKNRDGETVWITEIDGDNLIEFVDRNRKADKPFMMYWSPLAVHSSHRDIPEEFASRTTAPPKRRKLGGGIVCLDDQVGKLLDYLDQHDMRENTLIIFSSDNGANTSEGGSTTNRPTRSIGTWSPSAGRTGACTAMWRPMPGSCSISKKTRRSRRTWPAASPKWLSSLPGNTANGKARWRLAGKKRKKNIQAPARLPPKDTVG